MVQIFGKKNTGVVFKYMQFMPFFLFQPITVGLINEGEHRAELSLWVMILSIFLVGIELY